MNISGEYAITSIREDPENSRFIGTAIFPDKIEREVMIDFSEYFRYDPQKQEMVQLTVDNAGIRWDSIPEGD